MIMRYHVLERKIYILSKNIINFIEGKSNNEQIKYFNVIFLIEELT